MKQAPTVPVIEVPNQGYIRMVGQTVIFWCSNFIVHGVLSGVNDDVVEISDPSIVYETGDFKSKTLKDRQSIGVPYLLISKSAIEFAMPSWEK